ncbi:catalase-like domain-containing protein [Dimargaris cristalligena]|uniref:Catalase-like domain-containing protein n=1 Tax=Dimargaris cristalligena TaxID=215637 RepID=A0A4V1J475_9FUNG|nr:catalase-like domain-containing protein [Dimargaris cristalligena]|eukprot:RKP34579.1 catalase-like domain-containing protein [Dimargaris cristalligena]
MSMVTPSTWSPWLSLPDAVDKLTDYLRTVEPGTVTAPLARTCELSNLKPKSSRGTPDGFSSVLGYSRHTFKLADNHLALSHQPGGQELVPKRAAQLEGENPDYATQDLFNVIADNDFPSWTACIRFMEPEQAKKFRYHIFDISKVWSQKDPENYFAEVEQTAYSPGNMVPGIVASFNRMPQDRLFSHSNTHRHHLDSNFN